MVATLDDIFLIEVQRPGIDGTGIGTAEKAQLVTDVATALARPNITKLTDIGDVSPDGMASGKALIRNPENTGWIPGEQIGSISAVYDHTDTEVIADATSITAKKGLTAREGTGPNAVVLEARLGSSGTSEVLTREDHAHTLKADVPLRWAASGTLSSGSRTLTSGNVTGLDPAITYIVSAHLSGDLRGEGTGAGYTLPRITINSNARDRFDRVRTVAGVDRDWDMRHPGVSVSGVSSVAVSATLAFSEGDPINVGAGELVIHIESSR